MIIDFEEINKKRGNSNDRVSNQVDLSQEDIKDFGLLTSFDIVEFLDLELGLSIFDNEELNDDIIYDIMLVSEAISSLVARLNGDDTNMHEVAKKVLDIQEPEKLLESYKQNLVDTIPEV